MCIFTAEFNGARAARAILPKRNYSAGETFAFDLLLLNDDAAETAGVLDWRIDAPGLRGSVSVPAGRDRVVNLPAAVGGVFPRHIIKGIAMTGIK